MKIFHTVKKRLLLGAAFFCIVAAGGNGYLNAQPHNGTEQLPNRGFELYDNDGTSDIEPQGWNSFMTAVTANSTLAAGKSQRLSKESGGRTGSKGAYYLRVYSNEVLGVVANGNVTTGRINMGSMTATNAANYNYTDRDNEGFYWRQTTVPDSLVVWLWFKPKGSASDQAQINVIIHNDNRTIDPGTERSQVVAQAKINPTGTDGWQRFSVPFVKTGATNDAQYVLASFTTNKTPGGGKANDELLVDDIFFVYNPTLRLNNFNTTAIGLRDGENVTVEVPFRITGTMSPQMGNDNIVIAELSDASGSFAQAMEIGRLTTDVSGSIMASLPSTLPVGTGYRIRVRSTNYPRVSDDNGKNIELFRGYYIEGKASAQSRGSVSGSQTYKQGSQATLTAIATPGNHFSHWSENGNRLEGVNSVYTFTVERNRTLTAHFDTNYYEFTMQTEGNGTVTVAPQADNGRFIHNTPIRLQAQAGTGSSFVGFYDGTTLLNNQTDYTLLLVRDLNLTARFELQQYNLTVAANNAAFGNVKGSGAYKYQTTAKLEATPNAYCRFVAWQDADGNTLSTDNPYNYTVTAATRITGVFEEVTHRVTVASQPTAGGNVTGGGTYSASKSQKIELTAEAKPGYTFAYWTITRADGQTEDNNTDNPLTLVSGHINSDYTCTAYFEPVRYRITTLAEPEEGGSVEGDGLYIYQSQVRLTANPAEGYRFIGWRDAATGNDLSAQSIYTFQATADRRLMAVFELKQYDITVKSEPTAYGSVSGGGTYTHGVETILNAQAAEGYEFRYWYRNGDETDTVATTPEATVTITAAQQYTAVFTVKRKQANAVAVPGQGGEITGTGFYDDGAIAHLEAKAANGYSFGGWYDPKGNPLSYVDFLNLKMNRDTTVQAVFTPRLYTVTLAVAGNRNVGEVSFDNETFGTTLSASLPYDSTLTLYARAKTEGYKVSNWQKSGSGASLGKTAQIRYTVSGEARIEADFATDLATVAVTVEPEATGTVINAGNQPKGQHITLTAQPAEGYQLAHWEDATGATIGQGPTYTVEDLNDDIQLKAVFEKRQYTLQIAGSLPVAEAGQAEILPAAGDVVPAGALTLRHGDGFQLSAQPASGYRFDHWQKVGSDEILGTETPYEGTATQDASYRAVFAPLPYQLTTRASQAYKGRTRGDGNYLYGSEATVTAIPAEGNHFSAWVLTGDGLPDQGLTVQTNPYTFTVKGETTAEARFDTNTYTLTLQNAQTDLGTASMTIDGTAQADMSATILHNGQATFDATVKDAAHYRFACYTDRNGRKLSTANPWTMTVTSDTLVVATFEPLTFTLSVESADQAMGAASHTGGMEQPYRSTVTMTAEPAYGYQFVKWVLADEDGQATETVFSTAISTQFTLTQDTAILAVFAPQEFFINGEAAIDGSGYVEGLPDGGGLYPYGTEARVEATPAYGYAFSHWEINGVRMSDEPIYAWTVNETATATAVFSPVMFRIDLSLSPENVGYTTGGGLYGYGSTATLEAVPDEGYYFKGWHNGHHMVSKENPYRMAVGRDSSLTAILETDTLTVALQTDGEGEARGEGRFLMREPVTLEATPAPGHEFLAWTDDEGNRISTENPFEFPATADVTYTAVFMPKTYAVTLSTEAGGTLQGGGEYAYLSDVVLLARADSVHTFRCWQLDEESAEDSLLAALFTPEVLQQPRLTYRVDRPLGLTAVFDAFTYEITAEASPANSGTFRGTGTFNHGAATVLEALPAKHFDFVAWTLNGETVSTEPNLEIASIEENRLYIALFKPTEYQIAVTVYPSKGGVATGAGSYRFGDTVQIAVSMQPGYAFLDWTDNAFNVVSTETSFTHIVTGNESFTATVKAGNETGLTANGQLDVYPNPATEYLYFKAEADLRRIALIDTRGRLLRQVDVNGRQAVLRTSDCPAGLHFYRVEWQDGRVSHGKWVR